MGNRLPGPKSGCPIKLTGRNWERWSVYRESDKGCFMPKKKKNVPGLDRDHNKRIALMIIANHLPPEPTEALDVADQIRELLLRLGARRPED